jgi:hypothetical protein
MQAEQQNSAFARAVLLKDGRHLINGVVRVKGLFQSSLGVSLLDAVLDFTRIYERSQFLDLWRSESIILRRDTEGKSKQCTLKSVCWGMK